MKSKIHVKDTGWNRIKRGAVKLPPMRARVGIQGVEAEQERGPGLTNAGLAAVHEFGSPTQGIPERSFMRSAFDENTKRYQQELDALAKVALDGGNVEGDLLVLGETVRADMIEKIRSSIPPPLQEATVARKKGEETPLIDTGQLMGSIRAVVEKGKKSK